MDQASLYNRGFSKKRNNLLLESEIKAAHDVSINTLDAAAKLGVSHATYKKYAKIYNLYDEFYEKTKNKKSKRNFKHFFPNKKNLDKILKGEYDDNYSPRYLVKKLIKGKVKEEKCEICGFNEKRIDGKVPLMIGFLDGNRKNCKLENLELVCYNCAHNYYAMNLKKKQKFDRYFEI
jgi:hypothetical protein